MESSYGRVDHIVIYEYYGELFVSISELLDEIMQYEMHLEDLYAAIRDQSDSDGVRLLVFFLARSRRRIEAMINDHATAELTEIRQVELNKVPKIDLMKALEELAPAPDKVTSAQLLAFADKMDSLCVEHYKEVIMSSDNAKVDSLMDDFIEFKQLERVTLQKMAKVKY